MLRLACDNQLLWRYRCWSSRCGGQIMRCWKCQRSGVWSRGRRSLSHLGMGWKWERSPIFILGIVGYAVGLSGEIISEAQRKKFKDSPKHVGKAYTSGLFGFARHINYGSNMIWRVSYNIACGGWIYGWWMWCSLPTCFWRGLYRSWMSIVQEGEF